jgi:phospholipid N-methyltransferase
MPQGVLQEYMDFFRAVASKPKFTGAIAPSSKELARMMVRSFDLKSAPLVVEIGPGTGAFTRLILERLGDPARYLGLDLNANFVRKLRLKFPHASFYQGSAEHIAQFVAHHDGAQQADYVICGLPWAIFEADLQDRILGGINSILRPGGRFSTFAYVHGLRTLPALRFRRMLQRRFARVETSPIVWKNFPPAIVYYGTR